MARTKRIGQLKRVIATQEGRIVLIAKENLHNEKIPKNNWKRKARTDLTLTALWGQ